MMASAGLSNYPADKARGVELFFRRPWQRALFIAGLAGSVLLLLALDLS
jgi:hypothetical protein